MESAEVSAEKPKRRKTTPKKVKTPDSELARFNMHRLAEDEIASATAAQIDLMLADEERRNNKSQKNASKPKFEITESKKVTSSSLAANVVQIGRAHMKNVEEIIPLPPRPEKYVYTVSKDPKILNKRLEERKEEEKKRHSEKLFPSTEDSVSKKPRPSFESFESSIQSYEELFKNSRRYFTGPAKRTPKVRFSRVPRNVSARHIQNTLWQPYHEELRECCGSRTGTCQSLSPKLNHPLSKQKVCMAYLSEVQYEAYSKNESVSTLESESDQFFKNYLCVFCYRYNISRIIADDSTMQGSSITSDEIADYYHITGVEGEYRQDVCFQNQGGLLRGVNGNVVIYQPDTFVPVVGVISESNPRVISRILDMVDYENEAESLKDKKLAYGWSERGVFFKLNNNTVPECADINPYVYTYTRIKDGPLCARLILKGYFASRADTAKFSLFEDFNALLEGFNEIWKRPHPLITRRKVQQYELKKQYLDPEATSVWQKYHVWEHVCAHAATQPPNGRSCRIYYTFLYVINGLIELNEKNSSYPEEISKKLKRYINSFSNFQDYYKNCGGDYSDKRIQEERVVDTELELNCSKLFSCYPRVKKIGFVVHEYRYLAFETVTLKVPGPDVELAKLYASYAKPHSNITLSRESQIDTLLSQLKKLSTGSYHNLTVFYNQMVVLLREPKVLFDWCARNSLAWPRNLLVQNLHLKSSDVNRRSEMDTNAAAMSNAMERILRKVFELHRRENKQYRIYRKLLNLALEPFVNVHAKFTEIIQRDGAGSLFALIECEDLSYLLPDGYIADIDGINFIPWKENTILLTALIRVFILDRLIDLEDIEQRRKRYLLTLLRNSHVPLVNVICELPPDEPFKRNDSWLKYMSIMPQGGFVSHTHANYRPSLSYLDAYMPYPTLSFHQGRLPNLCSATTQTNYFFDGSSDMYTSFLNPIFKHKSSVTPCGGKKFKNIFSNDPVRHCLKTTITKLSKKKNVPAMIDTVNFSSIIPKRFFILNLLKCSFLGVYEHATVRPSFKITTQLLSLFDNADSQDVRELFDEFTTNFTTIGEKKKKLKFEKIMNDVILEYLNLLHTGTAIQHTVVNLYGVDPTHRAVIAMDYVRLGISQASLSLYTLYDLRQRNPVKLSAKVINNYCKSTVDRICEVILVSDEPRYASSNRKFAHIPKQFQIQDDEIVIVHSFIDKLNPTGTIYAENLKYVGLTDETIEALSKINNIVSQTPYNIEDAVKIFEDLEIRQSSIVAYFFNTLKEYLKYGELISCDKDFVEGQERALKKIAGIPKHVTDYELPKSIHHTAVCAACNIWNGVSPSSQYYMKEFVSETATHYLMPHGNQSVSVDLISGGLVCKITRKPAKKKKGNARDAPADSNASNEPKFFSVTSSYIEKSRAEGTEPKRLNTIRQMEYRTPHCGRIPLIMANLRGGRIFTTKDKVKHPYGKRKTQQFKDRVANMTNDPICIYPPLKPRPLIMANPPYTISPCCGNIRTTGPQCWGVNGYFCGACLPRSNIELAIVGEILCYSCRQVVPNAGGSRCPIKKCPSNMILALDANLRKQDLQCTHGASPVYVVDDKIGKPVYAYFCDSCYREFESCEPGLVSISSVVNRDSLPVMNVIEGKDFSTERKKPTSEY